jgi:hypothetical protein
MIEGLTIRKGKIQAEDWQERSGQRRPLFWRNVDTRQRAKDKCLKFV